MAASCLPCGYKITISVYCNHASGFITIISTPTALCSARLCSASLNADAEVRVFYQQVPIIFSEKDGANRGKHLAVGFPPLSQCDTMESNYVKALPAGNNAIETHIAFIPYRISQIHLNQKSHFQQRERQCHFG